MINIEVTSNFKRNHKKYIKNNLSNKKLVEITLKKFLVNPKHPSLNLEKLQNSKYWTIRLNSSDRIFFIWINKNIVLLFDIGSHNKYRKF